jgi:glutaminase
VLECKQTPGGDYIICKGNYDGRTALHLAASEGHLSIVQYLIESGCFIDIIPKDRWGNTPLDDAIRG